MVLNTLYNVLPIFLITPFTTTIGVPFLVITTT